jgi:hypothetical protein
VQRQTILLRINRYRSQAEFVRGPEDANGDLAAIGGEQFMNGFGLLHIGNKKYIARNSTLFHERGATRLRFF